MSLSEFLKVGYFRTVITRLVLPFLCILILGGIGLPVPAFDGCKIQTTINHQANFINMDLKLPSDVVIRRNVKNETIIFLRGRNLSESLEGDKNFRKLQSKNLLSEIALAFLSAHRLLFKVIQPPDELTVESITTDELGLKHVRFQQMFKGIPVWASEIIVHLDRSNHVYLAQGRYIPTPVTVNICPVLSQEEALRIVAENLEETGSECPRCRSELIIFAALDDGPRLAYRVLATPSVIEGWAFVIDAETGAILEKLPTVYNGGVPPMQMKDTMPTD